MESFRDDNDLIAELRALRPAPAPEFAAALDERAAAGFPRRSVPAGTPLTNLFARLRATPPRRLALAGGGLALATIAVATALVVASDAPKTHTSATLARLTPTQHSSALLEAESHRRVMRGSHLAHGNAEPRSSSDSSVESSGTQYRAASEALPDVKIVDGSGPYLVKAPHRKVEHSAEMVLGADPDRVADDAKQVFDAVHAADGIVLSSSVTGGAAGEAGARFELLIPAAKLSDALAALSAIDTVVSRHEATDDITAPTVRVGEHLRDSRAKIDGLLVQLAGAGSDSERAEVEAELSAERRRAASLRSRAAKLGRRANLSRVSLRIETGGATTGSGSSGAWGIGDALHDAGHILAIAAAVTVVGLAIVGPLTLIALLLWLANRAHLRRARGRALD